jgi:hypothetical protein
MSKNAIHCLPIPAQVFAHFPSGWSNQIKEAGIGFLAKYQMGFILSRPNLCSK